MNVSRRSFLSRVAAAFAGVAAIAKAKAEPLPLPPPPPVVKTSPTVLFGMLSKLQIESIENRDCYNWWERDPVKTHDYPTGAQDFTQQFKS